MQVKIDTREKFTVITPDVDALSDNLTDELAKLIQTNSQPDIGNVVLNLKNVSVIDESSVIKLVNLQQHFYEKNASFVICEVNEKLEEQLEEYEALDIMNITPTESEAWDIVQMEEIERELMDDDEPLFNNHKEEEEK
ncbi:STAS domain-containing protein [Foetidibacter luteolus]|uniref:STAS domain-containing protein n=1 Tax=Foetidibacter luteolus TaxID=2608880 RepID=UPI00129AD2BE|nr:STAS domain-containing protein [Foetidibacter luteolus]